MGLKHVEKEQVLNTLGVPRYANALTLKMAQLAPRLQSLPWVKSAVVRLDLPGRLVVEITEREVMAVVSAENDYLMDREGKLFSRTTREQSSDHLVVSGFSGKGLREGSMLPAEPFEALKKLLKSLEKAKGWLPLSQIAECRWQGDEGFILVAAHGNVPIRLGTDDLDQKLDRLHRIFQMLGDRQWLDMVTGIDLDYAHRAFVQGHFPHSKPPKAS
jgi:cell division septal protein FtsQ